MAVEPRAERYAARSLYYLKNASRFIDEGNTEKASEFLWGSMAQALKALAASRGIELKTHGAIWSFARTITKELQDKSIYDAFLHANFLHSNFYEAELELTDVRAMAEEIRVAVGKVLRLIMHESPEAQ